MAAAGTFRDDLSFHFVFRIVDPVVLLRQPFRHIFTANLHYLWFQSKSFFVLQLSGIEQ